MDFCGIFMAITCLVLLFIYHLKMARYKKISLLEEIKESIVMSNFTDYEFIDSSKIDKRKQSSKVKTIACKNTFKDAI